MEDIKMRIRFSKGGPLCFIGHLDFLRVFQQMIRRSGVPIAYSQGFNPHQILSFALPLPLGMASGNDYADIALTAPCEDIVARLNAVAPTGLVVHAAYLPEGKPAAAAAAIADYTLTASITPEQISAVLNAKEIVIPKKTKSGVKDTDIRPDIINITPTEAGAILKLSAGSARFLNPLLAAEVLLGEKPCPSQFVRQELYRQGDSGEFVPL